MSSRAPGTTAHPGPPRAPQPGDDDDDVMAAPAAAAAAAAPPDGLIVDTVVEPTQDEILVKLAKPAFGTMAEKRKTIELGPMVHRDAIIQKLKTTNPQLATEVKSAIPRVKKGLASTAASVAKQFHDVSTSLHAFLAVFEPRTSADHELVTNVQAVYDGMNKTVVAARQQVIDDKITAATKANIMHVHVHADQFPCGDAGRPPDRCRQF